MMLYIENTILAMLRFLRYRADVFMIMVAGVKRGKPASRGVKVRNKKTSTVTANFPLLRPGNLNAGFYEPAVLILLVVFGIIWAAQVLPLSTSLADEGYHWSQIQTFLAGGGYSTNISPLPGYHMTVTSLMQLLSLESLAATRYVSWFLSFSVLACFYWIVRKSGDGNPSALSLQLFLAPIIFPFFFLVYTDIVSLGMVLLSLQLMLDRRYRIAAVVAGISLVFRQTNIIWLFLFWLLALSDLGFFNEVKNFRNPRTVRFKELAGPLKKTYLYAVCCLLFVAFVFINKGVAMGEADKHSLKAIYPEQVFMLLFVLFFLFLPLHMKNVTAIWRLLKAQPLLPFLGAMLFAVYMITFSADHEYNRIEFYLRNQFVIWLRESTLNRSLAFIPMLWAFYSLMLTPLREKKYYWLYPVAILFLLPIGLIEPRYYIVPVVLFMLFRKPMDERLEYLTAAIYIPMTLFLFTGISAQSFFL